MAAIPIASTALVLSVAGVAVGSVAMNQATVNEGAIETNQGKINQNELDIQSLQNAAGGSGSLQAAFDVSAQPQITVKDSALQLRIGGVNTNGLLEGVNKEGSRDESENLLKFLGEFSLAM